MGKSVLVFLLPKKWVHIYLKSQDFFLIFMVLKRPSLTIPLDNSFKQIAWDNNLTVVWYGSMGGYSRVKYLVEKYLDFYKSIHRFLFANYQVVTAIVSSSQFQ